VKALQSGKQPDLEGPLHQGPDVDLHIPALIPDTYMPDVHLRLVLYKRIAAAEDAEALSELASEMIDRFGPLLPAIDNLYRVTRLKLLAIELGLKRLDAGPLGGVVEFTKEHTVDPDRVIKMIQREPKTYKLDGPHRLRFSKRTDTPMERIAVCEALLTGLTPDKAGTMTT